MAAIPHTVLLAAIRQCITVVEPGEVLAVRVPENTDDQEMDFLFRFASDIHEQSGARVLFLRAAEFARLKAADAPAQVNGVLTEEVFRALKKEIHRRGGSGHDSVQKALGGVA